ncbi:hypothetical protein DENSPDRAFT_854681 [Dentipellis sp. KUC8613]|nr:hypothetical protein DENSPDRAFT_854681 [Dentipellis sp. KUC8613]
MADALNDSIIRLASDLFAQKVAALHIHQHISMTLAFSKLYYVATSALWAYDYFLTLGDEVAYAYEGKKSYIFYLYLVVCARYGFMETFETTLLTTVGEIFLALRVYAITKKNKAVPVFTALVILWQWGIAVYVMSQSSKGTDLPALLLSRRGVSIPPLPTLPNIDPFHEAFLCISLAFDIVVFLIIIVTTTRALRQTQVKGMLHIIQKDGILYFFVLFFSNLVWLLLVLHARSGLKFLHNHISSIMVNRITLNLKRASHVNSVIPWSISTFEEHRGMVHGHPRSPSDDLYELRNLQEDPTLLVA